jgi:hypothetical protein
MARGSLNRPRAQPMCPAYPKVNEIASESRGDRINSAFSGCRTARFLHYFIAINRRNAIHRLNAAELNAFGIVGSFLRFDQINHAITSSRCVVVLEWHARRKHRASGAQSPQSISDHIIPCHVYLWYGRPTKGLSRLQADPIPYGQYADRLMPGSGPAEPRTSV